MIDDVKPDVSGGTTAAMGNASKRDIFLVFLLLLPFFYQLLHLPQDGALRIADSFRYLWQAEVSRYYFEASSLSVRTINLWLDNDLYLVALAQLSIGFLAPVFLYLSLRQHARGWNIILISVLVVLYLSAGPIRFHDVVSSESIFTSLFITFTAILFAYDGKGRLTWLLFTGILFIYSRNPAPYLVGVQLLLYLLLALRKPAGREVFVLLMLLGFSLHALWLIQCCDTTKEINVADNLYSRVFPYPQKVDYFHRHYGMPVGPFIEICQRSGSNVNSSCVNQQAIYTGDMVTRQYRLTNDDFGLTDWIRSDGMRAWQDFILFRDMRNTLQLYTEEYQRLSQSMFAGEYNVQINDVFALLGRALEKLGMLQLTGLLVYLLVGTTAYFLGLRDPVFKLGLVYMLCALPAFFIGLFGDSEEVKRYTYPAILSLYLGALLYLMSLARMLLFRMRQSQRRQGH